MHGTLSYSMNNTVRYSSSISSWFSYWDDWSSCLSAQSSPWIRSVNANIRSEIIAWKYIWLGVISLVFFPLGINCSISWSWSAVCSRLSVSHCRIWILVCSWRGVIVVILSNIFSRSIGIIVRSGCILVAIFLRTTFSLWSSILMILNWDISYYVKCIRNCIANWVAFVIRIFILESVLTFNNVGKIDIVPSITISLVTWNVFPICI